MPYDPEFLTGVTVPLPTLLGRTLTEAFNGGRPIEHTNHSVVFNQMRGLAVFSAHNIAGDQLVPGIPRRGFTLDPDVPPILQIDNDRGYKGFPDQHANPWDAGHLARRKGVHWPDEDTARQAERETAHWTNIAPQQSKLNQGPWLKIEDWLLEMADDDDRRMSVFTGPVFTITDLDWVNKPGELPIRIPSGYWKVAVLRNDGVVRSAAFLIWQTDVQPSVDDFDPDRFDPVLEQVRVFTIEHLAGIAFPDVVRQGDPLHFGQRPSVPTGAQPRPGAVAGAPLPPPPAPGVIRGPDDIVV